MKTRGYFMFCLLIIISACNNDDEGNSTTPTRANFTLTIENVAEAKSFIHSGVFNTPDGDDATGPATPGKEYEFNIDAGRSQSLTFVTMLAATNDLFFGPGGEGIALYDEMGDPITANVTSQVYLWDAGTEVNEEPFVGPNTVSKQASANTGEDENGNVLKIGDVTTGFEFDYPAVSDLIEVSITHIQDTRFRVNIEVLATAELETSEGTVAAPISPGVWVVHNGNNPLYTENEPDFVQGVEAIAEDGNPAALGAYAEENTGVTYPISPGVWVLHEKGTFPIYKLGTEDYGDGLEAIAEDGNTEILSENLSSLEGYITGGVFNTPTGADAPGPLRPGHTYEFSFEAEEGENLSIATMLAATNDVFIGAIGSGVILFEPDGTPRRGDITGKFLLIDAGTEQNEEPAVGPNTVTNQLEANTGIEENGTVALLSNVDDERTYPSVNQIIKVTLTPDE
ncbi:spondin domain-containing protein [Salegentibacter chungangensis]|uniref:Spondin domain-containing protein n=1 Tax=Salegentibacter chungangensis TaxID=1335724 RepID=A0ABW3NML3_9FLAO